MRNTTARRVTTRIQPPIRICFSGYVSREPKLKVISSKHFSFKSERCPIPEPSKEEDYPGFSEEDISKMNKIVKTMISAGYKNECSNAYSIARGNALYEQLRRLNFEKLNAEEVQKLSWEWLEADITRWIRIIKHFSHFLIPAEWKLGELVFSDDSSIFRGLFVNLIRSLITSLLDYAATVAMLKPSAERLFKFLDMYEALHGLNDAINGEEHESCNDLNSEISSVIERIAEGVVNMFGDLEKSIRHDAAKTPVPGGAVHPLTRYVLNYLRYACDYVDTLEQIFQQSAKLNQLPTSSSSPPEDMDTEKSPLAAQIASVMSLLDGNLAVKSTLYKDPSLRDIFLMNNGRYILQKVKGSSEIKKMLGDNWCRRRSSEVRHYHKS
ncbi:putative exocyst complex component Exo70, cullin repeat-like-containing domain superfamily [Helianthus debilis subsp. tardiflorus]